VITLPALGGATKGTVIGWFKQIGDHVEVGEPLLEVAIGQIDIEIPSRATGTLLQITVNEDEAVAVGRQLAVIADPPPLRWDFRRW
jgi:pyruvate dehydrogenase E2 component (dihydrolipoamide acetyltransferase)